MQPIAHIVTQQEEGDQEGGLGDQEELLGDEEEAHARFPGIKSAIRIFQLAWTCIGIATSLSLPLHERSWQEQGQ